MKTITKEAMLKALYRSVPYVIMALVMVGNVLPVFAADGDTIFSKFNETNKTVIDQFVMFFDKSILPALGVAYFFGMAFLGRNEKVAPTLLHSAKMVAFATVGINAINLVVNTLIWIANTLSGMSS